MFFKSQKRVEEKIALYCQKSEECVKLGLTLITDCIGESECDKRQDEVIKVHKSESVADDLRREIEYFIYERSLFPESRGDILGLLETLDYIPNQIQESVKMLVEQRIIIPQLLDGELRQMVQITQKSAEITFQAVRNLFSNFRDVLEMLGQIDALESEVDKIQSDLIIKIFKSDFEPFQKILLRDLINELENVSDYAEKAGDYMRIMIVKRMM